MWSWMRYVDITITGVFKADRLVDLGFEPDLNFILAELPAVFCKTGDSEVEDIPTPKGDDNTLRQITMFSATMPPAVERLAKRYLQRSATVTVGTIGFAVETVELRVEMISEERKRSRLLELLETVCNGGQTSHHDHKYRKKDGFDHRTREFAEKDHLQIQDRSLVLIFVNLKRTVDFLCKFLDARGYQAIGIHGGKTQEAREHALGRLREGSKRILIATDVASRGLDVRDLSVVINYDMSKSIEGKIIILVTISF